MATKINLTVDDIQRALNDADIEGLLEAGAPDDEYHSEANSIHEKLMAVPSYATLTDLKNLILETWAHSFDLSEDEIQMRLPFIETAAKNLFTKR